MIHQPPTNTPGHPFDPQNANYLTTWEHFAFTADTDGELAEAMAMFCLAGWSVWIAGLLDTPEGKRFGAVMYRTKEAGK